MDRRAFVTTLLAAIGLGKLVRSEPFALGKIYPSHPFGVFQIDEPYHTSWSSPNSPQVILPRSHYKGMWITQEIMDDDVFGLGRP